MRGDDSFPLLDSDLNELRSKLGTVECRAGMLGSGEGSVQILFCEDLVEMWWPWGPV